MHWQSSRGTRFLARALAAAVVLLAVSGGAAVGSVDRQQTASPSRDAATPLVATVLGLPHSVPATDGRVHLPYELLVTNITPSRMRIDQVETLDPENQDRVVATLAGAELAAAIQPFQPTDGPELAPSQVTRVFLDLTTELGGRLPTALAHRFSYTLSPPFRGEAGGTSRTGFTQVSQQEAVVVDPPLVGDRWIVTNGCCFPPSGHRTATLGVNGAIYAAQRFAIDFLQLDAAGRLFVGPEDDLKSYPFYGDPVYAAADGVAVRTLNDLPERVPGRLPTDTTIDNITGNYVVQDIGDGRFAFYAHMQTGSVRVNVGDRVRRGQVLGLLGNTGNTSAPHLHFHVMDGPSPLGSNGLPYTFRAFSVEGTLTSGLEGLFAPDPTAVIDRALAGQYQARLPLDYQLVSFPPLGARN